MHNVILPQLFYSAGFVVVVILIAIFELIMKGIGLWRAARKGQRWWFIAILVINSVGIIPLIYLLTHSGDKKEQ